MRTIRLEILRHGPPHNQLLSPLTEYLALCENHQSVTVKLACEHAEFMLRMRELHDQRAPAQFREMQLEDVARQVTGILAQVPGLIRELSGNGSRDGSDFHLRLILSANELALLPFEIANASPGFAGAGQPLFLQSQMPVCITREVRRVATEEAAWPPANPKILFAAAATPEAPIPLDAHLLALRQAIEPWMRHHKNDKERRERVAEHLTVLPQATLRQIEEACATGEYTHVHILAHGVPLERGDDRRFGLMLNRSGQPGTAEVIDAVRMAKALRPPARDGQGRFSCPAVVTLAACDAGNVGSVVGAGASIAHSLHEEGIPLVVASQFPLSFPGSVVMTKVLYEGLLWAHDPRVLLVNLRRQLKTMAPSTHDWASIVAYASFPANLDDQMARVRMRQAFRSLEAAIHHADRTLSERPPDTVLHAERDRLNAARDRIEQLIAAPQADTAVYGVLASADKRLAQILWRMEAAVGESNRKYRANVRDRLVSSCKYYRQAFRKERAAWALVQALALKAVLARWNPGDVITADEWNLARILSERDLELTDPQIRAWAHANLMELYLISPLLAPKPVDAAKARAEAASHANAFRNVADLNSVEIHSTRRQLLRYSEFFAEVNPKLKPLSPVAVALAAEFPESPVYA